MVRLPTTYDEVRASLGEALSVHWRRMAICNFAKIFVIFGTIFCHLLFSLLFCIAF